MHRRKLLIPIEKHLEQRKRRAAKKTKTTLPAKFDIVARMPTPYDQGNVGACTANAECAAFKALEADKTFEPSRMYLYYKERLVEEKPGEAIGDTGADPEDGLDWLHAHGVCAEASWPYAEENVDATPPAECDAEAALHKTAGYYHVDGSGASLHSAIKKAIFSGLPVVAGISVYESFLTDEVAKTGEVPYPHCLEFDDPNDPVDPYQGGHCILLVGWSDPDRKYLALNSWGTGWGLPSQPGYFHIPYSYVQEPALAQEFRAITKV